MDDAAMDTRSVFFDDWIRSLREQYKHVLRQDDRIALPSLTTVMLEVGFDEAELAALRDEAGAPVPSAAVETEPSPPQTQAADDAIEATEALVGASDTPIESAPESPAPEDSDAPPLTFEDSLALGDADTDDEADELEADAEAEAEADEINPAQISMF